jgi:hypothetical protein
VPARCERPPDLEQRLAERLLDYEILSDQCRSRLGFWTRSEMSEAEAIPDVLRM